MHKFEQNKLHQAYIVGMLIMYGCAAGVARDVEISVQQVLVGADVPYF